MRDDRPPLLAGAAATVMLLLPLLAAHHLPLLDAPGHEAELMVLRKLLFGSGVSPFYAPGSLFIPDLAFDGVGLALAAFFAPEQIGRVFLGMTLVLTLWGLLVLNRVVTRRWSPVPLTAALLLYNLVLIYGFFSYLFGLALLPWALAARLRLSPRQAGRGFLLGAGLGVVLLFCHLLAFGVYASFWIGVTAAAFVGGRIGWLGASARALELVPALGLLLAMPRGDPGALLYQAHYLAGKALGIPEALVSGSAVGDLALIVGAIAFAGLLCLSGRVVIAAGFGLGLTGVSLLYLALPLAMGAGANLDMRIPIAIALLGLAGLDIRLRPAVAPRLLAACIVAALIVKQGAIAMQWRSFDPRIDSIVAALGTIPPGAVLFQSECRRSGNFFESTYPNLQPSLSHTSALASLDDDRFIAKSWAIAGQQPISVTPRYRPYYDLQTSFHRFTCDPRGYREELTRIQNLMRQDREQPPLSVYFFLIRPAVADSLVPEAALRAAGPDFQLYFVGRPRGYAKGPVPIAATASRYSCGALANSSSHRSARCETVGP